MMLQEKPHRIMFRKLAVTNPVTGVWKMKISLHGTVPRRSTWSLLPDTPHNF